MTITDYLYILDDQYNVIRCTDLYEWGRWMQNSNRRIALTELGEKCRISTVFLGIDHQLDEGPPLVFETMILCEGNEELNYWCERCSTHAEALEQHLRVRNMAAKS
jgi:hypothetical protein